MTSEKGLSVEEAAPLMGGRTPIRNQQQQVAGLGRGKGEGRAPHSRPHPAFLVSPALLPLRGLSWDVYSQQTEHPVCSGKATRPGRPRGAGIEMTQGDGRPGSG